LDALLTESDHESRGRKRQKTGAGRQSGRRPAGRRKSEELSEEEWEEDWEGPQKRPTRERKAVDYAKLDDVDLEEEENGAAERVRTWEPCVVLVRLQVFEDSGFRCSWVICVYFGDGAQWNWIRGLGGDGAAEKGRVLSLYVRLDRIGENLGDFADLGLRHFCIHVNSVLLAVEKVLCGFNHSE
jgi:hypothetical protein